LERSSSVFEMMKALRDFFEYVNGLGVSSLIAVIGPVSVQLVQYNYFLLHKSTRYLECQVFYFSTVTVVQY